MWSIDDVLNPEQVLYPGPDVVGASTRSRLVVRGGECDMSTHRNGSARALPPRKHKIRAVMMNMMMVMGDRKRSATALQTRKVCVMIIARAQPRPCQHGL